MQSTPGYPFPRCCVQQNFTIRMQLNNGCGNICCHRSKDYLFNGMAIFSGNESIQYMVKLLFKECLGLTLAAFMLVSIPHAVSCQTKHFRVLVLASRAKDHLKMIAAAKPFLEKMGAENNFSVDFTDDSSKINTDNLAGYQVAGRPAKICGRREGLGGYSCGGPYRPAIPGSGNPILAMV